MNLKFFSLIMFFSIISFDSMIASNVQTGDEDLLTGLSDAQLRLFVEYNYERLEELFKLEAKIKNKCSFKARKEFEEAACRFIDKIEPVIKGYKKICAQYTIDSAYTNR